MYLENPEGVWMGISLILLVLFYLLRPKSKEVPFTSLMFLEEKKTTVHKRLFKVFNKNIFFYLQLLILSLLVLSASSPILEKLNKPQIEKQIVIVDLSASTSIPIIFEKLIRTVKEALGELNTIIVAENVPILLAEEKRIQESKEYLNELTPKHTRTNLREVLSYAIEFGKENKYKKIIIVSDFLTKEKLETSYDSAKKTGIEIKPLKIDNKRENVGIIDLIKKEDEIKIIIKNYGNNQEKREIATNKENIKIELEPKEKKIISLKGNIEKIEINPKDDFSADDTVFIVQNSSKRNKAVIISDLKNKNLDAALEANGFEVKYEKPPIINVNADLIILDKSNYERLVPGTFEEIRKKVEEGSEVVFNFIEKMPETELLPVIINSLEIEQESNIKFNVEDFDDLETLKITEKYIVELKKESVSIAKDDKSNSIIVYKKEGKGMVVYNGLANKYLENSPTYPLFWRAIARLAGKEKRENMYKTGEVLKLDKISKVKTPTTEITTESILLDEVGMYEIERERVAVNLLSEEESDFETESFAEYTIAEQVEGILNKEEKINKIRLEKSILLISISVLLFELYFAFKRGMI